MSKPLTQKQQRELITLLRQMDADKIPPILTPLWKPYRKKMIHGGRGSAKTQTACRILIRQGSNHRLRVLFAREILESIKESLWAELSLLIPILGYPGWDITEKRIINKITGSHFAFKGLRDLRAARAMTGYAHFDRLIVDQAEAVPEISWNLAVHTIREPGSEIWAIFNRYEDFDPVYKLYCISEDLKIETWQHYGKEYSYKTNGGTIVIECNWRDNPWFPPELRKEMEEMKKNDYDKYLWIYEGQPVAQLEFAVIERELVDIAMKANLQPDGPQIIGADIARHGMDKIKVYERRGAKVKKLFEMKHSEPIKAARKTADMADHQNIIINADNGGLGGGGYIDTLKELGFSNVNEINFGGTPKKKKEYANIATEMYFECKHKLPYLDLPDDMFLRQDLTGRLYDYDIKGRKRIEDKEAFRKRYQRSPDDGDATLLCIYDPGKKVKMNPEEKREMKKLVRERIAKNRKRFIS